MDAELALRLRAEALIAAVAHLTAEEAMGELADVDAIASALAATGVVAPEAAGSLVADTVDALVVRGASWVEPTAVDLDVRRLYDLAAGAARPRLRRVVPVASGALASVDLWDDRAEARIAGGPSVLLDAVHPGGRRLELRDEGGAVVVVDLSLGRAATEGGTVGRIDTAGYLSRLEVHAVAAARRDPSVATLNTLRRRLSAVGEALGEHGAIERFDAALTTFGVSPSPSSVLFEVVPVAVRAPFGWVLSIERWSDHWRGIVIAERRAAIWTAVDAAGNRYGGDLLDVEVIRFDPPLPDGWTSVTLQHLGADGTSVEVEVRR